MSLIGFWDKLWKRDKESFLSVAEEKRIKKEVSAATGLDPSCFRVVAVSDFNEGDSSSIFQRKIRFGAPEVGRSESLRAAIDTARRNKKKSSHLVAELDKLENGK